MSNENKWGSHFARLVYYVENVGDSYSFMETMNIGAPTDSVGICSGCEAHPLDEFPHARTLIFVSSNNFRDEDGARKLLPRWYEEPDRRAYRIDFEPGLSRGVVEHYIANAKLIDRSPYLKVKFLGKVENDALRVHIAAELTAKELRKLFPKSNIQENDLLALWNGKQDLRAIEDFWSGCNGVLDGFKKKKIIPMLLDGTLEWAQQIIPVDSLYITSPADFLHERAIEYPMPVTAMREALKDPLFYKRCLHSHTTMSGDGERDEFPLVVREEDSKYIVIDGNRRAVRALLLGHLTVDAYVAKKR